GYDRHYTLVPSGAPVPAGDWPTAVSHSGNRVTTGSPVLIDVGAAGKGYLVDLFAELLHDAGLHDFVVDASGDLLFSATEPRRVALEHPLDPSLAIGVVTMTS